MPCPQSKPQLWCMTYETSYVLCYCTSLFSKDCKRLCMDQHVQKHWHISIAASEPCAAQSRRWCRRCSPPPPASCPSPRGSRLGAACPPASGTWNRARVSKTRKKNFSEKAPPRGPLPGYALTHSILTAKKSLPFFVFSSLFFNF